MTEEDDYEFVPMYYDCQFAPQDLAVNIRTVRKIVPAVLQIFSLQMFF